MTTQSFWMGYGIPGNYLDVTATVVHYYYDGTAIHLPEGDHARAEIFGDPIPGKLKHLLVIYNSESSIYSAAIKCDHTATLDPEQWPKPVATPTWLGRRKLADIHSRIKLTHGHMNDEYHEQLMVAMFLRPEAKVLELGSNYGRNTMTISSILEDSSNLVSLECDPESYAKCVENRDRNGFACHCVSAALSDIRLIQHGWNTMPLTEPIPAGWKEIATISFDQLESTYDIQFDTIVADCEGALYYILQSRPTILNNITMLIVENDYPNVEHRMFVEGLLVGNRFTRAYVKSGGALPCPINRASMKCGPNKQDSRSGASWIQMMGCPSQ